MPPSDITSDPAESVRPRADPLPSKRGEIGYIEVAEPPQTLQTSNVHDIPTRHPLDRHPPQSEVVINTEQSSPTVSVAKSHGILDIFKPEASPTFGGIRLYTLLILTLHLILLGITVTTWVFSSKSLAQTLSGSSAIIPLHIIFIIIVLLQLVLLERRVFMLRGERYNYLHPGEILSRHRNMPQSNTIFAFAPWNRPSLPTYAASLLHSGVNTGDVEDHLIAGPPPPAYGNTRDSTLILSGVWRVSLGANSGCTDGPLSHVNRDEEWDQGRNAERARRWDETMNRLAQPAAAHIVVR